MSFFFMSSWYSKMCKLDCCSSCFFKLSISSCFSRKRRWNLWSNSNLSVPISFMCSSVSVFDAFSCCTKSSSFSIRLLNSSECFLLMRTSRCLYCFSSSVFVKSISCWCAFRVRVISSFRLSTWFLSSLFSTLKDANMTSYPSFIFSVSSLNPSISFSADSVSTRDDNCTTSTPICSFKFSHSFIFSCSCSWRFFMAASCWVVYFSRRAPSSSWDSSSLNFNSSISAAFSSFVTSSSLTRSCIVSFKRLICFLCSFSRDSLWDRISTSCWLRRSAWKALSNVSWSFNDSISFSYSSFICSFSCFTNSASWTAFFSCAWCSWINLDSSTVKSTLCFSTSVCFSAFTSSSSLLAWFTFVSKLFFSSLKFVSIFSSWASCLVTCSVIRPSCSSSFSWFNCSRFSTIPFNDSTSASISSRLTRCSSSILAKMFS